MKQKIIPAVIFTFLFAWAAGVIVFFFANGGQETYIGLNPLFIILAAALLFAAAVFGAFAARGIPDGFKSLAVLPPLLLTLAYVFIVPYSPSHDAYDISGFAEQFHRIGEFRQYAAAYLTYTASNRLVLFMYYPVMLLFNNIEAGARVLNAAFMVVSMFTLSKTASNLFGREMFFTALYTFPAFCPFVLLSAPYIYLPVIFLLSLSLMLLTSAGKKARIAGMTVSAFVFILRPTAFGVILVYVLFRSLFHKCTLKRVFNNVASVAVIVCIAAAAKGVFAEILYKTGLYPYPGLNNSASVWSLELGTRMQGEDTGLCTYSGYDNKGFDEISYDFHRIWEIRANADPADAKLLTELQNELQDKIVKRFVSRTLAKPSELWEFLRIKYVNYYRDGYIPYYTSIDLNRENAARMLYKNYTDRYYLYENTLLAAFYIISAILMIIAFISVIKKGAPDKETCAAAVLILSAAAVSMITIAAAEVGKRLMFDIYAPIFLVICFAVGRAVDFAEKGCARFGNSYRIKNILSAALCIAAAVGAACAYGSQNNETFKDASITIREDEITINLDEKHDLRGCRLSVYGEADKELGITDTIVLPNNDNNVEYCSIKFPDEKIVRISKLRKHSFDWLP